MRANSALLTERLHRAALRMRCGKTRTLGRSMDRTEWGKAKEVGR
jgi:hypothetical protein